MRTLLAAILILAIAIALIELNANTYDTHGYILDLKELRSHDFDALYEQYAEKYKI